MSEDPIERLKKLKDLPGGYLPSNPSKGLRYVQEETGKLREFDGDKWVDALPPYPQPKELPYLEVSPLLDGVFPKKVVIRTESTREVIFEKKLDRKDVAKFIPSMSGTYILEIYPVEEDHQSINIELIESEKDNEEEEISDV